MTKGTIYRAVLILTMAGMVTACSSAPPTMQTGPDAETTFDGLVRVDNASMEKVWVRPGIDLNSYGKVMPVIAETRYASVRSTSTSVARKTNQTNFALTDEEKARFQSLVGEVFLAEFAKSQKFELTDQPGEDVLLVKVELLDVASRVPPQEAVRETVYVRIIGDANLVLELYDSTSNQVLARASDSREFKYPGDRMQMSIRGMNESQVRRGLEAWAGILVTGLDSMKTR